MNSILKVKDLNIYINKQLIIDNLSFSVNKGEILCIVGPNGAGKTTLLKALSGSIKPNSGIIDWKEKNISYLPPQERIVRTNFPPMIVSDFFSLKSKDKQEIFKLFNELELNSKILDQPFDSLSTGQFQKMLIAWSVIGNPEILLLDDPVSGIDINGKQVVYSFLRKVWKELNLTIILVTHSLDMVWKQADNVLCVDKKKLCYGAPKEILTLENLKKIYGEKIKLYEWGHF